MTITTAVRRYRRTAHRPIPSRTIATATPSNNNTATSPGQVHRSTDCPRPVLALPVSAPRQNPSSRRNRVGPRLIARSHATISARIGERVPRVLVAQHRNTVLACRSFVGRLPPTPAARQPKATTAPPKGLPPPKAVHHAHRLALRRDPQPRRPALTRTAEYHGATTNSTVTCSIPTPVASQFDTESCRCSLRSLQGARSWPLTALQQPHQQQLQSRQTPAPPCPPTAAPKRPHTTARVEEQVRPLRRFLLLEKLLIDQDLRQRGHRGLRQVQPGLRMRRVPRRRSSRILAEELHGLQLASQFFCHGLAIFGPLL